MADRPGVIDPGIKSLDAHPELHQRVLIKAAELAEPAVRLTQPFDRVLATRLGPRTHYEALKTVAPDQAEQVLQDMIAVAKFRMCGEAFRDQAAIQRLREFGRARVSYDRPNPPPREPFNEAPVIAEVMKVRYPDFRLDAELPKNLSVRNGVQWFLTPFMTTNKLLIAIEATPLISTFFDLSIGVFDPLFGIREGDPWAVSGSWNYWDAESCERAVHGALDVVDIVLPPLMQKMKEALS